MDLTAFRESLREGNPPDGLSPALRALWHDGKGDWNRAHDCLQGQEDRDSAWVHAYLHRKEGDDGNAAYWYRRASQPVSTDTLDQEWESIAESLLS